MHIANTTLNFYFRIKFGLKSVLHLCFSIFAIGYVIVADVFVHILGHKHAILRSQGITEVSYKLTTNS